MTSTDAAADTRETVYAAIELSKKTWVLGIAPPTVIVRAFIASAAATSPSWSAGCGSRAGITVELWSATRPGMTASGWPVHW